MVEYLKKEVWTIVASLAALLSAIYAYRSNQLSKKAYLLAQRSYQDKQVNFSLYLNDSFRWSTTTNRKLLLFQCTISNKSENNNSYTVSLHLKYIREDNSVSTIVLDHNPSLSNLLNKNTLTFFNTEIKVEGKQILSNWMIFEQPILILKGQRIEQYSIVVSDVENNVEIVESYMIKEMRNGN